MSNRALKKLQDDKEKALGLVQTALSESDDASADTSTTNGATRKKVPNRFELLNSMDHSLSDTEAKEDDDKDERGTELPFDLDLVERNKLEKQDSTHSTDSLKRKKKRRKKKLKSQRSVEDHLDDAVSDEDEIDASLREVNKILGEPHGLHPVPSQGCQASSFPKSPSSQNVLSVDFRNLNPDNEMRRIFGAKVIQTEQVKRRNRGRSHCRPSMLFSPRNWPHVGKPGITMNLLETKNEIHYFSFEHSPHYVKVQLQFLDAVESYNPGHIAALLQVHHYHIDALIQFSEICKMGDDLQMAAEIIERALYCLENCFHPLFNITQGNCRLDFRKAENRAFFLAVFKHLNFVGQRGCNRTALEFCKVLLGLDPEGDPLCVLLMIDFYAIRSEQYDLLIKMSQEWDSERNLSQLPNFAFAVPMAHFFKANTAGKSTETADKMLQRALIMFPGLLNILLDKCGVQPDPVVANHPFFGSNALTSQTEALNQLIMLYVSRSYQLWKQKEVLLWLENNVSKVLKRVDSKDPYVNECAEKRQLRYRGTPRNIMRHIYLAGFKEVTVTLPQDNTPLFGFDPLPPTDSLTCYLRQPRQQQNTEDQGMLSMFFRSLLPNFNLDLGNAGVNRAEENDGAQGGEDRGETNDIRRSVTSLLDAMRDLLSNIQLADVPNDGDVESEEDHDQ